MAVRDTEAFVRELGLSYDPNMDTGPGSPFDTQVVQPIKRRFGMDPFTVDLSTFISDRMLQAFPDIANQEEDAVTDLLNKPATLLWDPLVREVIRVRQNLSFKDPSQMTLEEAESLGANFFSERKRGQLARGPGRVLFTAPQNLSVSPANFFTSKTGLHFFPTETQSIRSEEMILNVTSEGLYYFDVNTIAEAAGVEYNIGPDELIKVANMPSATRVTNTRKFRSGVTEEGVQTFISRTKQELTERSMVTLRGVAAKLVSGFPEIDRLNVIGFNDPEMQRDIIKGGGLGAVLAGGSAGLVVPDGEGKSLQRRLFTTEADFQVLIGSSDISGYVLTVFDAFGPTVPVQDLTVMRLVGPNELDVEEQVLILGSQNLRWTLRRRELTLSNIPGGILFPNTANGELTIADDEVHIGGLYDTYVRGTGFEEETFTISNVTDDEPLLRGLTATVVDAGGTNVIQLNSLVEGVDFVEGDATTQALDAAVRFGYTLQLQDPPEAGNYRVLSRAVAGGGQVQLTVTPEPSAPTVLTSRWRLFDVLNVDLLNPRETRVEGNDMSSLQNSDVLSVPAGTDFVALGVSEGDVVEIMAGPLAGQYNVAQAPLSPTSLQINTVLKDTASNLAYRVYRANAEQLSPPFVRVTGVELLDSSGQPLGTTIPYARPVDVQTRAFQNPARGVKHNLVDTLLGLVSQAATGVGNTFALTGTDLEFWVEGAATEQQVLTLTTTGPAVPLATIISELNAEFLSKYGLPQVVTQVGTDRFGIRPIGSQGFVALVNGNARLELFGNAELRTTGDIRSVTIVTAGGWDDVSPPIDFSTGLDVFQVLDGSDIGYYPAPFTTNYNNALWPSATVSEALLIGALDSNDYVPSKAFAPARQRQTQVGARSLGSARVYFLEPTSFEVDANTTFTLDLGVQGVVRFLPDPTLEQQKLPALPSNTPIQDGETLDSSTTFTSLSQDFILSGIQPGDRLVIETHPIEGTEVLADPVPGLAGSTLVFSLAGAADRTAIFLRDDASLSVGEVSRQGVIDQINAAAGETIAELTVDYRIRFSTAASLVVRGTNQGTANALLLGLVYGTGGVLDFATVNDQNNTSPHAGSYVVDAAGQTTLTLDTTTPPAVNHPFTAPITEQSFKVYRAGVQRISSTQMSDNQAEAGLFYFDVELISEGAGDLWNVDAQQQLMPAGYRSDGYYLTTDDTNLTFSEVERPKMVISRSILEAGVDDDPVNATQLTGENIEVTYDRSQLIADVQNFVSSETERVICANPLSRHLIPYFVRFDVQYTGGSREDLVVTDLEAYTKDLAPVDTLDASDVQKTVTDRGASYVKNPLELIAVVHNVDRSVWIERSQDQLALTNRLSAFIPERITATREVS